MLKAVVTLQKTKELATGTKGRYPGTTLGNMVEVAMSHETRISGDANMPTCTTNARVGM